MAIEALRWNKGVLEMYHEYSDEWTPVRNKSCIKIQIETVKQKPFDPSLEAKGLAQHIRKELLDIMEIRRVPPEEYFNILIDQCFRAKAGIPDVSEKQNSLRASRRDLNELSTSLFDYIDAKTYEGKALPEPDIRNFLITYFDEKADK